LVYSCISQNRQENSIPKDRFKNGQKMSLTFSTNQLYYKHNQPTTEKLMRIHEDQNNSYRSKSTCGYCRETGHNQYQCPHVKGDWENFLSKWKFPVDKNGLPIKRGYNQVAWARGIGNNDALTINIYNNCFASWFRNCRKAYAVQLERGFNLAGKPKRKVPAARTCGFCGSKSHTRRNCSTMEQFLKDCYKANENWRRAAYCELVEQAGLSVGACVEVSVSEGYSRPTTQKTGIITKINWDTINVLSACTSTSSFAHSPLKVEILVNGEKRTLKNLHNKFKCLGKNGAGNGYWGVELTKVITNSPTPLPPEWITSYKESFETLVKKKTSEQLKHGMASDYSSPNIMAHIAAWK